MKAILPKDTHKLILFSIILLLIVFIILWNYLLKNKNEGFENEQEKIPKVIHQIWIGPREPPTKWINRWKDDYTRMYPDFTHVIWNQEKIDKEIENSKF